VHQRYILNGGLLYDGGAGSAKSRHGFALLVLSARRMARRRLAFAKTMLVSCRRPTRVVARLLMKNRSSDFRSGLFDRYIRHGTLDIPTFVIVRAARRLD
jgi:hypothetical protein